MPRRIELLDVLRGVAILGTLGTNIWLFANAGNLNALFGANTYQAGLEYALQQATLFFTNGKFLGMLTILFGMGLELQYQSARRRSVPFLPAYLWRATLLFLDGLLHFALVIEFDILMGYAVTAMIVAFVVTRPERVQRAAMWAAGGLHLLLVTGLSALLWTLPPDELERSVGSSSLSQAYLNGSYWDGVVARLTHFWEWRAEPIFVIPMGVALFLFGAHLFRSGAFSNTPEGSRITGLMMRWGLGLGVPLNLLALEPSLGLDIFGRYVFAPIMAVGYIGLIAQIVQRGWLARAQNAVALVGRMALSNYMGQGVMASILFYGWGFGLARQPNAFVALAAWLGISAVLLVVSRLWLARFKQGPFETVWKYLSELPFKRQRLEPQP
jgi:uncharacterized protein